MNTSNTSRTVAAIILAAGSSSRMGAGRHKLLLPLAGQPVMAHVIEATLASQVRPIVVVLGHQATQVRTHIVAYTEHPRITIVENPAYLQGMSTSMRAGIHTLLVCAQQQTIVAPGAALILLGDQPFMTARVLDTLIAAWQERGKPIIAPLYAGIRGNPVLFAADLFPELLEVTGDEGGRSIVERHRHEMATVEVSDAMASYDLDTWEAYQQAVKAWESKQNT
ncbi:MAG: molybdenum cofactor cytidylyltransferase [Ktedonobacteraceae bacterium]|nr:molybdenum cofactor cytidylyltransferase [Ktedonobacteraceae bacterium]